MGKGARHGCHRVIAASSEWHWEQGTKYAVESLMLQFPEATSLSSSGRDNCRLSVSTQQAPDLMLVNRYTAILAGGADSDLSARTLGHSTLLNAWPISDIRAMNHHDRDAL